MAFLTSLRAKLVARQELKAQVEERARPVRIASLKKQERIFKEQAQERALRSKVTQMKYSRLTRVAENITQGVKSLTKNVARRQQLQKRVKKLKGVPSQELFNTPKSSDLFEVKDWRNK